MRAFLAQMFFQNMYKNKNERAVKPTPFLKKIAACECLYVCENPKLIGVSSQGETPKKNNVLSIG